LKTFFNEEKENNEESLGGSFVANILLFKVNVKRATLTHKKINITVITKCLKREKINLLKDKNEWTWFISAVLFDFNEVQVKILKM